MLERVVVAMDTIPEQIIGQIGKLVQKLKTAEMILGSRYINDGTIEKWSLYRKFLSRFGNLYLHLTLGTSGVTDFTTNFRAFSAASLWPVIKNFDLLPNDWSFLTAFVALAAQSLRIDEVPIIFADRLHGESKLNSLAYSRRLLLLPWHYRMNQLTKHYDKFLKTNWSRLFSRV